MFKVVQNETKILAERVLEMAIYNAEKEDCQDIPEFWAYEILDLTELMCENYVVHDRVLGEVLKYNGLSDETKRIVLDLHPLKKG